jgi:hypothetical protein
MSFNQIIEHLNKIEYLHLCPAGPLRNRCALPILMRSLAGVNVVSVMAI